MQYNPFINSLNRNQYLRQKTSFEHCSPDTSVPESQSYTSMLYEQRERQASLQVPHDYEVPMGCENTYMMNMNIDPSRYFTCPDGSVIDLKTRKKVVANKVDRETQEHSKMRWIDRFTQNDNQWGRINDMIRNFDPSHPYQSAMGMTKDDIAYQEMANRESAKLKANMTQEQKNVLANLEKFIGKNTVETID